MMNIMTMLQVQKSLFALLRPGTRIKNSLFLPITALPTTKLYSSKTSFASILHLEEHKNIKTELSMLKEPGTLDTLARAILVQNIRVPRVALLNNVVVFKKPGKLSIIQRRELPKNLPQEIKTGKFSPDEDETLLHNYDKLIAETNTNKEDAQNAVFNIKNKDKITGKKLNILGYYLGQDLTSPRLATEIIQRTRQLKCGNMFTELTPTEDKIILEFVKSNGEKWAELARLLNRACNSTVKRRYEVLTGKNRKGEFTIDESKIVLTLILTAEKNTLVNGIVTDETCKKIGEKLQRDYKGVYKHWRNVLEPILKMYKAETLDKDIRGDLLNHLLQQGTKYSQDVDWEELAKLPQFSGTTSHYLRCIYATLMTSTRNTYPDTTRAERTTELVKKFWDNRECSDRVDAINETVKRKKKLREDAIIKHYQELCNKHNIS